MQQHKYSAASPDFCVAQQQIVQLFCSVLPDFAADQDWHVALQPIYNLHAATLQQSGTRSL